MQYIGIFGIIVLLSIAWGLSENRRAINWRTVAIGVLFQFFLALLLVKFPPSKALFFWLNDLVLALEKATLAGTTMVFGFLGGAPLPFDEKFPGASFTLAFRALPLILVVSALSRLLFHWGVLQKIVQLFSLVLQRLLGIGGAVGVSAAANVFVGMVEAPLLIRPYLKRMSRGELFIVMTCGMATIAGTVLALYAMILRDTIPDALGHILTASIISAPAAIVVALLMVPPEGAATAGDIADDLHSAGSMDAVSKGTVDGLSLLLNIVAMLIVLVALVHLVNQILMLLPFAEVLTLQRLFGTALAPLAWLIGIPWSEAMTAGGLLGTKTVLNEFIAYLQLSALGADDLSERSRLIMTYAMCGFANFGSLGIMIGGLGSMAPERRSEIVTLGFRSIFSGLLATCMTGAIVGLLV